MTWEYPCQDKECECPRCSHMLIVVDSPYENKQGNVVYPGMCKDISAPEIFEIPAEELESYIRDNERPQHQIEISMSESHTDTMENSSHHKHSTAEEGFTNEDRKMLRQIHRASVYGDTPTDAQIAGDVRRKQVEYGLDRYRPSSKYQKGISATKAASLAINASEFEGLEGAYTSSEIKTLARAIQRAIRKRKNH